MLFQALIAIELHVPRMTGMILKIPIIFSPIKNVPRMTGMILDAAGIYKRLSNVPRMTGMIPHTNEYLSV